jgi:hypothetical protein
MGMVDDGHVKQTHTLTKSPLRSFKSLSRRNVRSLTAIGWLVGIRCCCRRSTPSLITFHVVVMLYSWSIVCIQCFCVGHVYFKSGLLQVFGITEFADESHRRGGNGGYGLAGGKGTWG